jgi:predicted RNA-binding protein associated with RNAse of E/G family
MMLKRKHGDRSEWKRVLKREYAQSYLETENFKGHITLLKLVKVRESLIAKYDQQSVCIADDGYFWLQQFPDHKHHSVTTMFDAEGNIIQWYIDICRMNGVSTDNIPWMDDLFLDIIVLPSGEVIQKDANELEGALLRDIIDKTLYDLAWQESGHLISLINGGHFTLLNLSVEHKNFLLEKLNADYKLDTL